MGKYKEEEEGEKIVMPCNYICERFLVQRRDETRKKSKNNNSFYVNKTYNRRIIRSFNAVVVGGSDTNYTYRRCRKCSIFLAYEIFGPRCPCCSNLLSNAYKKSNDRINLRRRIRKKSKLKMYKVKIKSRGGK